MSGEFCCDTSQDGNEVGLSGPDFMFCCILPVHVGRNELEGGSPLFGDLLLVFVSDLVVEYVEINKEATLLEA